MMSPKSAEEFKSTPGKPSDTVVPALQVQRGCPEFDDCVRRPCQPVSAGIQTGGQDDRLPDPRRACRHEVVVENRVRTVLESTSCGSVWWGSSLICQGSISSRQAVEASTIRH
jgi:hypothetical protein